MVTLHHTNSFTNFMEAASSEFINQTRGEACLHHDSFYCIVKYRGHGNELYDAFMGMAVDVHASGEELSTDADALARGYRMSGLNGGWCASFDYTGDMAYIRTTFEGDLYRWIALKNLTPNPEGVGMVSIYKQDYPTTKNVNILVPIMRPIAESSLGKELSID